MGLSGPMFKYVILLVAVLAYFYYRMIKGRRRRGELHGRERLHEAFRQRRRDRLSSAATWEDRRRLRGDPHGGRRIKAELLKGGGPQRRGGGPADGAAAEERAGPAQPAAPKADERSSGRSG
jgi:hypothetical protein